MVKSFHRFISQIQLLQLQNNLFDKIDINYNCEIFPREIEVFPKSSAKIIIFIKFVNDFVVSICA